MKICRVATVPFFLWNHLRTQIAETVAAGHEVVLVSQGGPDAEKLKSIHGVRFVELNIERKISPWSDFLAVVKLYFLFRREAFDVVHTTTPKAGFLAGIAGFVARVPVRIHTFTGQVWMGMSGIRRQVMAASDWVTAYLSTHSFADSFSQRDFLLEKLGIRSERISVLGEGSLAGVDLERYSLDRFLQERTALKAEIGIPNAQRVVVFIGRITRDKGIYELVLALRQLQMRGVSVALILIGPEEDDAADVYRAAGLEELKDVYRLGYRGDPERWLAISDVLCIPSYREGFGNVVIEAAAMAVPSVGTDIVGLRDSIVSGETGLLVPVRDANALAAALEMLLRDEALLSALGERAMKRTHALFGAQYVNRLVVEQYQVLARKT